jgi:hypothetical protein
MSAGAVSIRCSVDEPFLRSLFCSRDMEVVEMGFSCWFQLRARNVQRCLRLYANELALIAKRMNNKIIFPLLRQSMSSGMIHKHYLHAFILKYFFFCSHVHLKKKFHCLMRKFSSLFLCVFVWLVEASLWVCACVREKGIFLAYWKFLFKELR